MKNHAKLFEKINPVNKKIIVKVWREEAESGGVIKANPERMPIATVLKVSEGSEHPYKTDDVVFMRLNGDVLYLGEILPDIDKDIALVNVYNLYGYVPKKEAEAALKNKKA